MSLPVVIPPGATILYDVFGNEYYALPSGQVVFLKSGVPPTQIPITSIIGTTNRINVTSPSIGVYQVDISANYINSSLSGLTPNYFPIASSSNTIANSSFFQTTSKITDSISNNYINFNDSINGVTINTNSNGFTTDSFISCTSLDALGGSITTGTRGSVDGSIVFFNNINNNRVTLQSGITGSNINFTLPTSYPSTNGQILSATTGGVMSWIEGIRTLKVTLTSAQILALNSVPIQLIAAPGAGFAIQPISIATKISTYGGSAYSSFTNMRFYLNSLASFLVSDTVTLSSVSTVFTTPGGNINNGGNMIENAPLMVAVLNGNPTAGNSDVIVYISYRIIIL